MDNLVGPWTTKIGGEASGEDHEDVLDMVDVVVLVVVVEVETVVAHKEGAEAVLDCMIL